MVRDAAHAGALHREFVEFRLWQDQREYAINRESLADLAGHNLACWCKPDQPCHADTLIELANGAV